MNQGYKICSRCKLNLSYDNYGRDKQKKDGLCSECRFCKSIAKRQAYAEDPERFLKPNRESYQRHKRTAARRSAEYYRKNKDKIINRIFKNEQLRGFARTKLNYAVRSGKLHRPNVCETCSVDCKPEGHHPDYAKPLEVKWLCKSCHGKEHRKYANA